MEDDRIVSFADGSSLLRAARERDETREAQRTKTEFEDAMVILERCLNKAYQIAASTGQRDHVFALCEQMMQRIRQDR